MDPKTHANNRVSEPASALGKELGPPHIWEGQELSGATRETTEWLSAHPS